MKYGISQTFREDYAVKCIVCGEDKSPDIRFDVPVICSQCALAQLQRVAADHQLRRASFESDTARNDD